MEAISSPEPLSDEHDTTRFDCGRSSLKDWLRLTALKNQKLGVSRTSVITVPPSRSVIAYVALSAAQIERAFLPRSGQRNKLDPIPTLLLGRLAVDRAHQGRGLASSLLQFALQTCVRISDEIGSLGVITHPIDDDVRAFYGRWGFVELPGDPRRAMIVRIADLKANGFWI